MTMIWYDTKQHYTNPFINGLSDQMWNLQMKKHLYTVNTFIQYASDSIQYSFSFTSYPSGDHLYTS